jgi:non-ribosomal peptide synthetase component F
LKALSRQESATIFMTLLAAFQTLLYRYTQQDDMIIGIPIAGRNRRETENLIGFFVNMLVLRTDLSGNPTFKQLLERVRKVALGAYSHQDLPFERLLEEIQPEREVINAPLFQVAFGYERLTNLNASIQGQAIDGARVQMLGSLNETVRYDLTVWIIEDAGRLRVAWTYSSDLFEDASISRMHSHFETLLRNIVAQPEARLDMLEILTDSDKQQMAEKYKTLKETNLKKLLTIRPKSVIGSNQGCLRKE